MKLYKYAVNFWNPETDDEFSVWCMAESWFSAEEVLLPLNLDGWVRGAHFFADDNSYITDSQFTLEEFKEKHK